LIQLPFFLDESHLCFYNKGKVENTLHQCELQTQDILEWSFSGFQTSEKTPQMKFSNKGNFDAYGIEAIAYSPDESTIISDSLIGGGGRIEAGETFIPDDTFNFNRIRGNYTEPSILVKYNDPQGFHSFITKLNLEDFDQNIENKANEMFRKPRLEVYINEQYAYNSDNWLILDYFNPDITIQNSNLYAVYQDPNGTIIHTEHKIQDVQEGSNSFIFWWKPSDYLTEEKIGEMCKVVVLMTDYQGTEIADDVQKFRIVNYPVENLKYKFSDDTLEKDLIFTDTVTEQIINLKITKEAKITEARLQIEGVQDGSCFPYSPNMEIGNVDGIKEWKLEQVELQNQKAVLKELNDGSSVKTLTFTDVNESQTVYLKIPKHAMVTSANFKLSGDYGDSIYSYIYDNFDEANSRQKLDPNLWDEEKKRIPDIGPKTNIEFAVNEFGNLLILVA